MAATAQSDPSPDLFEFFTATAPEMCAADDVILGGKLLPFGAPPPPPPKRAQTHVPNFSEPDHRRSNSLRDRPRGSLGGKVTAEYRKLRRVSDSDSDSDPPNPRRPSWYVLVFGSVRLPAEMELKEIRIRQRRRSAPPPPPKRDSSEWGPWKLLQSFELQGDGGGGCRCLKCPCGIFKEWRRFGKCPCRARAIGGIVGVNYRGQVFVCPRELTRRLTFSVDRF